ncbi:hypothetical protein SAMN02910400_02564 [Lachnospiraceae bacterium C10]|nr:hypothetical protein SAMN02910400_02564 [Lachnospiraceae bacterium C10]
MGKNRQPKRGGFQNQQNNGQKTKADMVEELKQAQKDKIDASLITDERVAAKMEELEKAKTDLKTEYKEKELALAEREEKLNEKEKQQQEKEKKLADTEAQIKKQCESAVAEEVARIKGDERAIREAEKTAIYKEWEEDKTNQKKELEEYVKEQRNKVDEELKKAHSERLEAEEKKLERIHEADKAIEDKRAELTKEYEDKMSEFVKKKHEYEEMLRELKEDRADFEEDQEYVKRLKEKYSQYSEEEVLKLREQIAHFEARIKSDEEIIKEYRDKNTRMESSLLDDDGHSLVVRIQELEGQLEEANQKNDELANMPSVDEIERLRAKAKELETVRVALDDEKQKRNEAEAKISAYAMSARELENARVAAAALESLNNQLQMKLKYISEQYKTTQESKFKVLLDIDSEISEQGIYNPKGFGKSLKDLCDYIRSYGSARKGLYYSIETIRVFIASLAAADRASRLLILQGLSGTGKSSLPRLVAEALGAECKRVSVQPSWRDNRELLGYDNDFTNRFKETEFTKYLYEASALPNRNKLYIILLDEMNLARIEYYFADFLSVLEETDKSKWTVPLVSGYSELDEDQKPKYLDYSNEAANICITSNVWFVGTANNDDSTSLITDKVYDRAQVLDMDERESEFKSRKPAQISMDIDELIGLFDTAKSDDSNRMNEADREKIRQVDEYLKEMDITFGNRIVSQMEDFIPVYIACGGEKNEAIDYFLTHKILRKLDERYEPYLVEKLEDLRQCLNDTYGEGVFKQSLEKIKKLTEKIQG